MFFSNLNSFILNLRFVSFAFLNILQKYLSFLKRHQFFSSTFPFYLLCGWRFTKFLRFFFNWICIFFTFLFKGYPKLIYFFLFISRIKFCFLFLYFISFFFFSTFWFCLKDFKKLIFKFFFFNVFYLFIFCFILQPFFSSKKFLSQDFFTYRFVKERINRQGFIRSPFVHKKSFEHFGNLTYKLEFFCFNSFLFTFLKNLQKNFYFFSLAFGFYVLKRNLFRVFYIEIT